MSVRKRNRTKWNARRKTITREILMPYSQAKQIPNCGTAEQPTQPMGTNNLQSTFGAAPTKSKHWLSPTPRLRRQKLHEYQFAKLRASLWRITKRRHCVTNAPAMDQKIELAVASRQQFHAMGDTIASQQTGSPNEGQHKRTSSGDE